MFIHIEQDSVYLLIAQKRQLLEVVGTSRVKVNRVFGEVEQLVLQFLIVGGTNLGELLIDIPNDVLQACVVVCPARKKPTETQQYGDQTTLQN